MIEASRSLHGEDCFKDLTHRLMILVTGGGGDFGVGLNVRKATNDSDRKPKLRCTWPFTEKKVSRTLKRR
jgi:hypothetical protein